MPQPDGKPRFDPSVRQVPGLELWIGHAGDVRDQSARIAAGIEAAVGLAIEDFAFPITRDMITCRVPLIDGLGNPRRFLVMAIDTVVNLLRSGTPTLVYCGAGMSRSPCIAAAAIAALRGGDPGETLDLVTRSGPADLSAGLWEDVLVVLAEIHDRTDRSQTCEPTKVGAIDMALAGLVKPIPDGYHTVTPYLIVEGAASAIEFYKKAFGATELYHINGPGGTIAHAEIRIGDSPVMLAEVSPEMGMKCPKGHGGSPVSLVLYVEDVDSFVGRAVAAGAKLTRPVEDKFYGDRGGSLEDPYGHAWHVMTHIENVSPEEMRKRAAAFESKS